MRVEERVDSDHQPIMDERGREGRRKREGLVGKGKGEVCGQRKVGKVLRNILGKRMREGQRWRRVGRN